MEQLHFTQFVQCYVKVLAAVSKALEISERLGRGRHEQPGKMVT